MRGLTAAEIDIELIAPALFLVGEKWATGEITVADEHLASEIALRVLALQREARRTVRRRRRRRVLLLAPEGERHVIGLHMASDLLFAAGYDTLMLGADVPLADIGARRRAPRRRRRLLHRDDAGDAPSASTPRSTTCAARGPAARSCSAAARCRSRSPRAGAPSVCADVSDAVASVDALVHRAPLN